MKRQVDRVDIYLDSLEHFQKLEKSLAIKLGLAELRTGIQVIRNNNGWRENEKLIEYIWIVIVERSFIGWGGIFSIKFEENKFREHANPSELVQGIFICSNNGIDQIYVSSTTNLNDSIAKMHSYNLFEANKGITLDGVAYTIKIVADNINTFIKLNNPNTEEWKKWEAELFGLGQKLANKSENSGMVELFKL